ncbi:sulfite reductase flavoprotein subunit alpha [Rheinheimera metallidurans]|uniref:sulfite reductase flavoprotein subunit alpha n=1 Tax=Rheinheimera metallidurans TaxID=2925781 RepID=UPI003002D08D
MLQRWQLLLEKWHLLILLVLPIYYFSSAKTDEWQPIAMLYFLYAIIVTASLLLKPRSITQPKLTGFAWLEQLLLLALFITVLWLFYLPQAPLNSVSGKVLWLNVQLVIAGVLYKLYLAIKVSRSNKIEITAPCWLVGYASQSGMALQLAQYSRKQLQSAGYKVDLAELNQLTLQKLHQYKNALFIVSTYGEGEPPDNANQFYQLAQQWQHSLNQLQFAVLALGDRSYQQFCAFGHWLHRRLHSLDAKALQPIIELDSADRQSQALAKWQLLLNGFGKPVADTVIDSTPWLQASLHSRYVVNPASAGLPCYTVKLQLPAASTWQAGDIVDIQPENNRSSVALWLTKHLVNGCQPVRYQQRTIPLCWALAELELDKAAPPTRNENLSTWLTQQTKLPLRSYSIASIPEEGHLTLLVRQVQKDDGSLGIGSGWLTAWANEQQNVQLRLRQHSQFHLPDDDKPIIFIANGTGIAAIRALLAERVKRGQPQNWLLFGERRQQHDFFFARDIQQWQQQGFIQHCELAFSQDQATKRYVQHLLAEQQARLVQWLEQGAAIYVCGSLQGMGVEVHQQLQQLLGTEQVEQLMQQGRYKRDLY